MRRTFLALCVATAAAVALPAAGATAAVAAPRAARGDRPDMQLRVSTHHGPMPLALTLTGKITAVDPAQFVDCVITVEHDYVTPAGTALNSKEEMPCRASADQPKTPAVLKKEVTLEEPGTYSYRIVMVRKDGKRMASTSQEVKVYRGAVEAGVTKRDR